MTARISKLPHWFIPGGSSLQYKPVFKIQVKKNMSLYVRYQQIDSGLSVIRYDTTMHQSDIFYMVEDSYTFRVQKSVNSTNLAVSVESIGFSDYDSLPVTLIDSKFSLVFHGISYQEMSEADMTKAESMLAKYFNLKVL